jgi:hypothetical protein
MTNIAINSNLPVINNSHEPILNEELRYRKAARHLIAWRKAVFELDEPMTHVCAAVIWAGIILGAVARHPILGISIATPGVIGLLALNRVRNYHSQKMTDMADDFPLDLHDLSSQAIKRRLARNSIVPISNRQTNKPLQSSQWGGQGGRAAPPLMKTPSAIGHAF